MQAGAIAQFSPTAMSRRAFICPRLLLATCEPMHSPSSGIVIYSAHFPTVRTGEVIAFAAISGPTVAGAAPGRSLTPVMSRPGIRAATTATPPPGNPQIPGACPIDDQVRHNAVPTIPRRSNEAFYNPRYLKKRRRQRLGVAETLVLSLGVKTQRDSKLQPRGREGSLILAYARQICARQNQAS